MSRYTWPCTFCINFVFLNIYREFFCSVILVEWTLVVYLSKHSLLTGPWSLILSQSSIFNICPDSALCPISALFLFITFLSKVLEKLIQKQLITFFNNHSILNLFQSGFHSGHSTTIKLTDDIRKVMDNKQLTILVLFDFSNGFVTFIKIYCRVCYVLITYFRL